MMRLGIDTFSLRFQGFDAFQFLDYAAQQGLDVVQFSTRENLDSHDPTYLREVKSHAGRLGLDVEIGMGSIDKYAASFRPDLGTGAEQLAGMCRAAAHLGSPLVRCFLGMQSDRAGRVPFAEHVAECVRTIREVAPLARDLGLTIAPENHGFTDLTATEMKAMVEAIGTDVAAVTLDTGNPTYGGEDPVYTAEVLAPYVVTTHFRDTAVWEDEQGAYAQWTVLGKGNADLRAVLGILQADTPSVAVNLEVITGGQPKLVPYLDPHSDYWKWYPDIPARALARFVKLARDGTRAGMGPLDQITGQLGQNIDPDVAARLKEQQRAHFEQSVRYAKETLGLGKRR